MAVVVNYEFPVSGTVAPTAQQATECNMLVAQITWGDTDLVALVTHNWNIAQPQVPAAWTGTYGPSTIFPVVQIALDPTSAGTALATTMISATLTNSVVVSIKKASAAGTNGTVNVVLLRPMSLIQ